MSEKTYTIQEIRDMIGVHLDEMAPLKYLDAVSGVIAVQDFLGEVQYADRHYGDIFEVECNE